MLGLLRFELISDDADLQSHTSRAGKEAGNPRKSGQIETILSVCNADNITQIQYSTSSDTFQSFLFLLVLLLATVLNANAVCALLPTGNPWHQRINFSLCLALVIGNKFYLVIVLGKLNKGTISADEPLLSQSNRLALIQCR